MYIAVDIVPAVAAEWATSSIECEILIISNRSNLNYNQLNFRVCVSSY